MSGYEDMMGLEYGDFGAFDMDMFKEAVIASAAGGTSLLAGSWLANKIVGAEMMPQFVKDNRKVVKGVLLVAMGTIGGSFLYNRHRASAIGVLGGLGSLGIANIVNSFLGDNTVPLEGNDSRDESLLSSYDNMAALAALEATSVQESAGAFSNFADPTVTPEQLMGFDGTVVQQETLGGYPAYLS